MHRCSSIPGSGRVFLGVAKRVYRLSEGADLSVWGLACTLPPYVLAARLNQNLGWNLARSLHDAELALGQGGEISYFQLFFQPLEQHGLPLCMVSNRGSLGLLLPRVRGIDYVLTWPSDEGSLETRDVRSELSAVAGVDLAADLRSGLPAKVMDFLRFDPRSQA